MKQTNKIIQLVTYKADNELSVQHFQMASFNEIKLRCNCVSHLIFKKFIITANSTGLSKHDIDEKR